jgi:aquaporin Z
MSTIGSTVAKKEGAMAAFVARQEAIVKTMPAKEMPRVYFAEILGTWMLVMVAAGGGTIAAYVGQTAGPAQVVAPALMVAASIYVLGPISGAHYNPAVTLAFAIRQDFPWRHVIPFWICQMAGSMLAALVLKALFGLAGGLGTTIPHHGALTSMVMEIILTFLLVTIILGTASDRKIVGTNAALAVGFTIALDGLFAAPISGASMNPARSLGPAIISWTFDSQWVYVVGPCAGAAIACVVAYLLRGSTTRDAIEAGSGLMANEEHVPARSGASPAE